MNTSRLDSPQQRRLLALDHANRVRGARAVLKRRLRAGEIAATEAILRRSSDIDTMTVAELLRSQRGWGPKRAAKVLRAVVLSESKTIGSLTERQRTTLVQVLGSREHG
jgi:hypothetical protein